MKKNVSLGKKLHGNRSLLMFAWPAILLYVVFIFFPFLQGIYYSFTDWDGMSVWGEWVGLANYQKIFSNSGEFVDSLLFTLKFGIVTVVFQNVGAILLATALDRVMRGKNFFRTIFFMPNVLAAVVVAFTWNFVFTKGFSALYEITGLEFLHWSWFGSSNLAFWVLVIVAQWLGMGYLMIIYVAGLQNIPRQYVEAARIDGAGAWKLFFKIKIPFLMPSIVIGVFTVTMNSIRQFDLVFLMTSGGPYQSTETLAFKVYQTAYNAFEFGEASAQAVIMFLLVAVVTFAEVAFMKRKEIEA